MTEETIYHSRDMSFKGQIIFDFLLSHSEIFRELAVIKKEGWNNPEGDAHFQRQRQYIDNAPLKEQHRHIKLMRKVGDEMEATTGALSFSEPHARVLDICMAPGAFSEKMLQYSPQAIVSGLTLPVSLGGHPVLVPFGSAERLDVSFLDVTMLATEFGVSDIPVDHPEKIHLSLWRHKRPWADTLFDLVFCDGNSLRTHEPHYAEYRKQHEKTRLMCSQLILAFQRIRPGSTVIMLLHNVEMWETAELLERIDKVSEMTLFKSTVSHRIRGSFYLIAKNVQPYLPEALEAVAHWKVVWKRTTFPEPAETNMQSPTDADKGTERKEVVELLANFSDRLIGLGEPIWKIQSEALQEAPWFKRASDTVRTASVDGASETGSPSAALIMENDG
ncbi:hypothetical protein ACLMJK_001413 [Lecanora helva]